MEITVSEGKYWLYPNSQKEIEYFDELMKKEVIRGDFLIMYTNISQFRVIRDGYPCIVICISKEDLKRLKEVYQRTTLIESFINHILYFQNKKGLI